MLAIRQKETICLQIARDVLHKSIDRALYTTTQLKEDSIELTEEDYFQLNNPKV